MDKTAARPDGPALIVGQLDERKGRLLVEIKEDVISTQVPALREGLRRIIDTAGASPWKALYIDIRGSRMVDSMGVNWLFAEAMRMKDAKRQVVIRLSSPAINRVMQFAGLDKLVTLKFRRRKQTR